MSIFNWFNKIIGIDSSKTNIDLPSDFQIPTENNDTRNYNFGYNEFIGPFERKKKFEDSIDIFHSNIEDMLRQFELEFSTIDNDNNNINNTNVYTVRINVNGEEINNFHHKQTEEDKNKIPRKNFLARNYFLSSR